MRKLLQITGVALLAGSWAAVAGATPPSITTMTFVEILEIADCGKYHVLWERETKLTEKVWSDHDGNATRITTKLQLIAGEIYNDVYPGISISQRKNGVGEIVILDENLAAGEIHASGPAFRLTIPGIGHVLMNAGTFKRDEEGDMVLDGLSALAERETARALCEALAP